MADNNNVFILFEEIKTTLNGIKSKLEELPDVADRHWALPPRRRKP